MARSVDLLRVPTITMNQNENTEDETDEATDELTYSVKHTVSAGWGGNTETTRTHVSCHSIEVADGLLRFLDESGNDEWAIRTDRVLEYGRRSY